MSLLTGVVRGSVSEPSSPATPLGPYSSAPQMSPGAAGVVRSPGSVHSPATGGHPGQSAPHEHRCVVLSDMLSIVIQTGRVQTSSNFFSCFSAFPTGQPSSHGSQHAEFVGELPRRKISRPSLGGGTRGILKVFSVMFSTLL